MSAASASDALKAVTVASDKFAMDLYMSLKSDSSNMVMSPLGVQIVLAMVAMGAKGSTFDELAKTLHLPKDLKTVGAGYHSLLEALEAPELKMANSIFVEKALELVPDFSQDMVNYFSSTIQKLPFQDNAAEAADSINHWADNHTNGKIRDMFNSDSVKNAAVVLANAIHFKAKWKYQFQEKLTEDAKFHTSNTTHVMVKMMSIKGKFRFGYVPEIKSKILELPYEHDRFRMIIILPDEIEGLAEAETKLHALGIDQALKYLNMGTVIVKLPRFKIESELDLVDALRKLGLNKIFEDGSNLSGMLKGSSKVNKVKQKAFIEVNEEGTEAAAVTAVITHYRSLIIEPPSPPQFVADHPFAYVIIANFLEYNGETIVFVGRTLSLSD